MGWVDCCYPECFNELTDRRASLFDPGRAPCLQCGERLAQVEKTAKSKRVVSMHKSNQVYVSPTAQGREFAAHCAQMRKGVFG